MRKEENILKEKIDNLRSKKISITDELDKLMKTCEHRFISGYQGDIIIFCEICNRDASDIFPNMPYKHIQKLVENE